MKRVRLAVIAVLLAAIMVFAAGCGDKTENGRETTPTDTVKVTAFKAGRWTSGGEDYMVFDADGKGGYMVDSVGFAYELDEDGSAVFHMGAIEDITRATVKFADENNATIIWQGGSAVDMTYAGEAGETFFKAGQWAKDGKAYMIFEDDGKSGEIIDSVGFEYELGIDGSAVFHMGGVDDNTKATVKFADEDNVTITWEDGGTIELTYIGEVETAETTETTKATEAAKTITKFKAGQWISGGEVYMVFDKDGKSGFVVDSVSFEYELKKDGSCVFHMGSVDDNTKATVKFTDEENATITWKKSGKKIKIKYAGEYKEPKTENTITKFKAGQWTCGGEVYMVFEKDGKSGFIVDSAPFAYELKKDGSCVFHMGSVDDNTKATVKFTDEENATITWKKGGSVKIKYAGKYTAPDNKKDSVEAKDFVGTWINDEGKFTATMTVEISDNGMPYFEVEWQENSALTYIYRFYGKNIKDGKLTYEDGFKGYVDIDADHVETKKILDEEAEGTVQFNSEGVIVWTEAADEKNPHIFVKKD